MVDVEVVVRVMVGVVEGLGVFVTVGVVVKVLVGKGKQVPVADKFTTSNSEVE